MNLRKHYKLYKSGKQWLVMALALVVGVVSVATSVNADTSVTSSTEVENSSQINDNNVLSGTTNNEVSLNTENSSENGAQTTESANLNSSNGNQTQESNSGAETTKTVEAQYTSAKLASATSQAQSRNGWVKENNQWVYYNNGQKLSGRSYSYLPTVTSSGTGTGYNWYLVDNGVVQSGVQKWANTYYDFDSNTYLRVDNNYVQSQWGMWYLFGNDGRIQTGVQKWYGTYYYFDPSTYLRVDNDYRQSQWGMWYLFGSDGRIQTGVQKWAGTYYYFDPSTYLRVDNDYRQSQWGDWYLFGNDGRILSGLQKWAGSYYYFDPSTYLKITNSNVIVNGISLHADNTGIISGVNSNSSFLLSIFNASLDGWRQYGILPSVTAAQAILESAWGRSALATEGHNLFGIKGSYNGQSITMRTAEYGNGGYYYVNAAFRKYPSNYESVVDHGRFLASNKRYGNLLWQRNYATVTNYLHADGYATDPNYASSLNNVIRNYGLDAWDKAVL